MKTRIAKVLVGQNPPEMQTGYCEYLTVILDNKGFFQIIVNIGEEAIDFARALERMATEIRRLATEIRED